MMRHQVANHKQKRAIRFPGLCQAAERLGVDRSHLYRVLVGERRSPRIEASKIFVALLQQRQTGTPIGQAYHSSKPTRHQRTAESAHDSAAAGKTATLDRRGSRLVAVTAGRDPHHFAGTAEVDV